MKTENNQAFSPSPKKPQVSSTPIKQNSFSQKQHNHSPSFHCNKCNKCVDSNPVQFDLMDYLKEAQTREFNEFNNGEHPSSTDANFQVSNQINELLVLANLFFFKGSNVYQEVINLEKDTSGMRNLIMKQEKELESLRQTEAQFNLISKELELTRELNKKNQETIDKLTLQAKNNEETIDRLSEENKELDNLERLLKENNSYELKSKSDSKLINELENSIKRLEDQAKTVNTFIQNLQNDLAEAKNAANDKVKQFKELKEEVAKGERRLIEKESMVKNLTKEKDMQRARFLEEVRLLEAERDKEKEKCSKLDELTYELELKERTIKDKTNLIQTLEETISKKVNSVSTLESDNKKLKNQIKSLEDSQSNMTRNVEMLTRENQRLTKEAKINEELVRSNAEIVKKRGKNEYEAQVNTLANVDSSLQMSPKRDNSAGSNQRRYKSVQYSPDTLNRAKNTLLPVDKSSEYLQTEVDKSGGGSIKQRKSMSSILMNSQNETPKIPSPPRKSLAASNEYNKSVTFDDGSLENVWSNFSKQFTNVSDTFETMCMKTYFKGNWRVRIKLVKMTYGIHFGISSKKIEFNEIKNRAFLGKYDNEYALNLYSGYLWKSDKKFQKIDKEFHDGAVIDMIVEKGCLYFRCGGDTFLAFKNIPDGNYPAATLMKKDDCIEIIEAANM